MTTQEAHVAVIVLGATGRVGRALLPILADGTRTVIGVVRDKKPDMTRPDLHWMQVNVTERDVWRRSLLALSGIASIYQRTIVIDLVLDRRTVSAMRRSIADTTGYTRKLVDTIAERGSAPVLVAASTTAILAPWLYQTPYGLAKRRQAESYATIPGSQIMLLPSLSAQSDNSGAAWNYQRAALIVAATVHTVAIAANPSARLWLPTLLPLPRLSSTLISRLAEATGAHLRCFVSRRDDPWAHRRAARSRLDLTPRSLRTRVDHHIAPRHLAARFARHSNLLVEHTTRLEDLYEGLCAS